MAPEILYGDVYTNKCDIWSLGCVFYEMLTGKPPFNGNNRVDFMASLYQGIYKVHKNCISAEGLEFLQQLLKKNPKDRIDWKSIWNHSYLKSNNVMKTKWRPVDLNSENSI